MLRRERPDVRRRISKEPDSFPSINPTSSSCIGYTVARLLRTLTPLGIIDIGKSASVYECRRFTCTIKQHLGQMPPKHVAGLPIQVVNDKGSFISLVFCFYGR